MSNWFSEIFKSKEEREKEVEEQAKKIAEQMLERQREEEEEKKRREEEEHRKKIEDAEDNFDALSEKYKESSEPYVNLRSMDFDSENGLKLNIDWNDAFIRYLNKNGIKRDNEEETVRLWLAFLYNDIDRRVNMEKYVNSSEVDEKPNKDHVDAFFNSLDDE